VGETVRLRTIGLGSIDTHRGFWPAWLVPIPIAVIGDMRVFRVITWPYPGLVGYGESIDIASVSGHCGGYGAPRNGREIPSPRYPDFTE
jgi:hypothetical protein